MKTLMNRWPFRILSVGALAAGITTSFRETATAQSDNVGAVRAGLLQNAAGFECGDLAALNKVWANDEAVTVFENGHANYGWADYRDHHLVPEMQEMKNTKYTLTDIKPRVAGKTAWATFKYTILSRLQRAQSRWRRARHGGARRA